MSEGESGMNTIDLANGTLTEFPKATITTLQFFYGFSSMYGPSRMRLFQSGIFPMDQTT